MGSAAAVNVMGLDLVSFVQVLSLIALPFAHEDLAIVLGAYIVVNDLMPAGLVIASIYSGMVVSDFALYGIGAGARRVPWLKRLAIDDRVQRFADVLKRNIFVIVALCRLVPGVVFVAFVACGWVRVSLTRFTIASLLLSAIYLPVMLYLVIVFGDALDNHLGLWAWPLLLIALAAGGFVRQRILAFRGTYGTAAGVAGAPRWVGADFVGLPSLAGLEKNVASAERIPPLLFYLPLVCNWLLLGLRYRSVTLPSAANPFIPTGGMWGESKSECLSQITGGERCTVADFVVLRRRNDPSTLPLDFARAQHLLAVAGLGLPVVAKPDIGWHGYGVRLIADAAALQDYLEKFPGGANLILQRYVPHAGEAAVLYARIPGETNGRILSLTLRYFPHVLGDGSSALRELIRRDARARWKSRLHLGFDLTHLGPDATALDSVPERGEVVRVALIGSQRAGALYRDASHSITPALDEKFDAIARSMREFHYGRFDLRFESIEKFLCGEGISIVEINGIGGEAIDAWDPELSIAETYRRLFAQQRMMFAIGALNRERGFEPTDPAAFLRLLLAQIDLIKRYPASS